MIFSATVMLSMKTLRECFRQLHGRHLCWHDVIAIGQQPTAASSVELHDIAHVWGSVFCDSCLCPVTGSKDH